MDPKHITKLLALAYLEERGGNTEMSLDTLKELAGDLHTGIWIQEVPSKPGVLRIGIDAR